MAMSRPSTLKIRASPLGISSTLPIRIWHAISRLRCRDGRSELVHGLGSRRLLPRIIGGVDRSLHRRIESGAESIAVLHNDRANSLDADSSDKIVGTLAPFGVLAVKLHEPGVICDRGLVAVHRAHEVALADMRAAGTADIDLPSAVADRDESYVFDQCFGAVPGAACGRKFQLRGAVDPPEAFLDLVCEPHAVAEAIAAEVRTNAALAGPIAFAPSEAGRHTQRPPNAR